MDPQILHRRELWALVRRQHGVISRLQLLALGLDGDAIKHRAAKGRLHPLWRGVYAVGRPEVTQHGRWMAAVLACGEGAALSHGDGAALWRMRKSRPGRIDISVPASRTVRLEGIVVHRRKTFEVTTCDGIPVTTPIATLIDLAASLPRGQVESAINEADKRDLVDPETLRAALDEIPSRPGAAKLRRILDRHTFTLTDSELERLYLRVARRAGLPPPDPREPIRGFTPDFAYRSLGLVIETDGLRYHRTPEQQAHDRIRDQAYAAEGHTTLRFTHSQVKFEPRSVEDVLARVRARLQPISRS